MPTFAEKARQAQQEKRSGQGEKDPADLSGSQEPDWDNPDSWGGDGSDAGDSASGNAGDSADGNDGQAPEPAAPATRTPKAASRTARRRGRPRGPDREALTVRVLPATNRMLTVAVEETGLNPQTIVEEAMQAHFRRLKIQDPGPESASGEGVA
ncbi:MULTISPECIES: hypothetical protein [Streptomyces]|uniref:Uncharacterized protein n=1 Tax=Streptomyces tsukubensis (strain DSM 42081 / NBRC 108919 / NRRL 18488 / 9993) TaxID=1114943 RepID=I2MSY1_STRT9|nr:MULTISPECIES: hypothetical protein [Streptomyces]AZK98795.1 hypothetical protein B7R87_33070 [Streptomyces tsukubensis]EIF87878.1 hypothetical protein [Streptomyces tsukubensis NRRL18488]MYS66007.1 hypothetical protein [Streptomyces sp. SID5473]QKM65796.1 hypothetical protein STSU_000115 [Streptomyces tsukubensis NRRL18488]